jgi:hypothetical protein
MEMETVWVFNQPCDPTPDLMSLLVENERILAAFKTVRDIAAFTDRRIIVRDSQGISGKKIECYSLPYDAINMWSTENAGKLDLTSEVELWTRAGHIKINLGRKCDIRMIDNLIANRVLK